MIEQGKFCFKIWVADADQRKFKRQQMHESVLRHCPNRGIVAKRPQRFGHGQYMTVAVLDQEFPPVRPNRLIDQDATLAIVHAAQAVVTDSADFV